MGNGYKEKVLKDREERFRRAVCESPVPIIIYDEDGRVLMLSKGWTHFSGYTIEDIPTIGDWMEAAYGERSGSKKDYIDSLFSLDESLENGEWNIRAKNGETRIWKFFTTPLGRANEGKKVLHSLALDITDQKVASETLITKIEELERFNELTVDRELKMISLKEEINSLLRKSGEKDKYKIAE
jgi:PAS domain S-box-containing protein